MLNIFHLAAATLLLLNGLPTSARDMCRPSTINDAAKIPGYAKLLEALQADFQAIPDSITGPDSDPNTNPADVGTVREDSRNTRDSQICASDGPYDIVSDPATLKCVAQEVIYTATYNNMFGFLRLDVNSGYTSLNTLKVTHTSSYGIDLLTGLSLKYTGPGVGDSILFPLFEGTGLEGSIKVTNRWSFSDSESSEVTKTINQVVNYAATCNGVSGLECSMSMNISQCFAEATVTVPVQFSGWLRANFKDPVTYAGQGEDAKRRSWWFSPELTYGLSVADDLNTQIIIQGSLSQESRSKTYIRGVNVTSETVTPLPEGTNFTSTLPGSTAGNATAQSAGNGTEQVTSPLPTGAPGTGTAGSAPAAAPAPVLPAASA